MRAGGISSRMSNIYPVACYIYGLLKGTGIQFVIARVVGLITLLAPKIDVFKNTYRSPDSIPWGGGGFHPFPVSTTIVLGTGRISQPFSYAINSLKSSTGQPHL